MALFKNRLLRLAGVVALVGITVFTSHLALKYIHWKTKSNGYPGLFEQTDSYTFNQVDDTIKSLRWKMIAIDLGNDGDILGWPDAKKASFALYRDTLWLKVELHNNLDINAPMITVAIEDEQGRDWYGTVEDFKYGSMISAGYFRKGDTYLGYNSIDGEKGKCSLKYDLKSNSLFLGISYNKVLTLRDKRAVVSVGHLGLWNDDINEPILIESIVKRK